MIGPIRLGPPSEHSPIAVPEISIPSPHLPAAFDGFRIALLADLHFGGFVQAPYARRAFELARQLRPDIALLCGDMVERPQMCKADLAEMLAELTASVRTYAVLGNHEYYGRVEGYCRAIRDAGVDLLVNEHRLLDPAGRWGRAPDQTIALAGLDDIAAGTPDAQAALAGVPPGTFTILVGHNPDLADRVGPDAGVDLMLCGHTHGGQIRIFGWAPITFTRNRRYLDGLTPGPGFPIYISGGLGVTGVPLRIGTEAELPVITLRSS